MAGGPSWGLDWNVYVPPWSGILAAVAAIPLLNSLGLMKNGIEIAISGTIDYWKDILQMLVFLSMIVIYT